MANLTLREGRATPLSVQEVDDNFTALNTDKLEVSEFNASNILAKLRTVDGAGSQLDADMVDGLSPTASNQSSTLVSRDASGNFAANTITANLIGNVTGNITGNAETVTNGVYTTGVGVVTNTMLAGGITNNKLVNSSITINGTAVSLGGSINTLTADNTWLGIQTFRDDKFIVVDNEDPTRKVQLQVSSVAANTTRTLTIPNSNGTIATEEYVQTAGRNSQGTKYVSTSAPAGTGFVVGDMWYQHN